MRYRIIDSFLSAEECSRIIEMAKPRIEPSSSWDVDSGSAQVNDYRNSKQMFFWKGENDFIRKIEDHVACLSGQPIDNGEGFQVLRYMPGEHYRVHYDWFDPKFGSNTQLLERGGQRIMTIIIYLNTVEKGGETRFPRVPNEDSSDSLAIKPVQGRAILWWNVDEKGNIDSSTLHEGVDVIEGEKWILTKWIRERTFV